MVSIKDIAREARVSHSTVSRALRNSPLVNPETSELIHRIAAEKGYVASAVARSLVTKRTNTVGVVVTTIADPFAGEVVGGIEELLLAHEYSVILVASHSDPGRELRAVQSLQERRVDGICVMASQIGAHYLSSLSEMKTPIVLINSHHPGEFVHSIRIDDVAGARMAMRHLIELGHKRIAYIGDRNGYQSNADRLAGYRKSLKAANLEMAPEYVMQVEGTPAGGLEAMSQLLKLSRRPSAVFCYNDRQSFGAMRAAREAGLRVPADISIIGFDDLFLSSYSDPPLTTVRQPKHEMGREAAEILFDLLAGRRPKSRIVEPELIVRASTAPLRVGKSASR